MYLVQTLYVMYLFDSSSPFSSKARVKNIYVICLTITFSSAFQ